MRVGNGPRFGIGLVMECLEIQAIAFLHIEPLLKYSTTRFKKVFVFAIHVITLDV